ncbi:MAG: glycoside hydrolase family 3 N-terminal domain-containing protein [Candidatus Latescibacterota bacterium]
MTNEDTALSPAVKFHLVKRIESHKIIALNETRLLPHEEKYLEFHNVSGMILFERNVESLTQLADLIGSVSEKLSNDGLPALIMADHEGDTVSVLRRLIGAPPSPWAIAMAGDLALARQVACETGQEMRKLGVNIVLAPVADCVLDTSSPVTGLRSFGTNPERVAEFVRHTILGYKDAGVISCVKHFPGHGSTAEDSHEVLPVVAKSREDLAAADLVPFVAALREQVEMVMISHVAYPLEGEDEIPASFDHRIINGLLRDELEFRGVVITDALDMGASITYRRGRFGGIAGGTERPLLAGADLLLYSSPIPTEMQMEESGEQMMSLKVMEMIIHTLERIIDKDRIGKKVEEEAALNDGLQALLNILNASDKRVLALRQQLAGIPPVKEPARDKVIRLDEYASTPSIYKEIAEKSIVLAGDPAGFVPIAEGTACLLMPIAHISGHSLRPQNLVEFLSVLRKHFPSWRKTDLMVDFTVDGDGRVQPISARALRVRASREGWTAQPGDEGAEVIAEELEVPQGMTLLPVLSARGVPPEEWMAHLEMFLDLHHVPFMIVTGWPMSRELPQSIGRLLTFGASPQVASVVAGILAGSIAPLQSRSDV